MENDKKNKVYKIIMLILITVTITFMCTSIGMYNYFIKSDEGNIKSLVKYIETSAETEIITEKFEIIKKYLEQYYIGDIDLEKMEETAIKGYVEGIDDEYTEYLTKDEYNELLVSVTGDYMGIGIYMTQDKEKNIIVLLPIEGSPAEAAGLQAGDIILSIDGEDCDEMDINIASAKIKGEEGTTVELEIYRGNEIIKKQIERKKIEIKDSSSTILENNIGYIELLTFDEGCNDNISKFLEEFQNKNINSVIIDLRNNSGGIVDEAIKVSELFVKQGDIIMRSYNKANEETTITSNNNNPIDMNIVVLVNEYSASATEIVTAALKDNNVAEIVGTKTYGKGVMQEILSLAELNFQGALKVTIEEFKTPNGDKINTVGITPDEIIEDDITTEEDEQLQKAIEMLK